MERNPRLVIDFHSGTAEDLIEFTHAMVDQGWGRETHIRFCSSKRMWSVTLSYPVSQSLKQHPTLRDVFRFASPLQDDVKGEHRIR